MNDQTTAVDTVHVAGVILALCATFMVSCLSSCEKQRRPDPILPEDTHMCAAACDNLQALGCEEGEPTASGVSCEDFCKETQDRGHALNPTCVAKVTSCAQVDDCTGGGP